jgi:vancomycin permeability regulator SanA
VASPTARRIVLFGIAGILVLGVLYVLVVFITVSRAATDAQEVDTATGQALIVLGAAQYNGRPSPVFERRLLVALELWEAGAAPLIVTTGSNQPGDNFTEGFAGFRYLREAGVPEDRIVVIVDGGDTYESLLATANQFESGAEVVIVTDAYHARRSGEVADEVGLNAVVVAAGSDTALSRRVRETAAVAIGRIIGYRRLSSLR